MKLRVLIRACFTRQEIVVPNNCAKSQVEIKQSQQEWWHMPLVLVLARRRQADLSEFNVSWGYILDSRPAKIYYESLCYKKPT